MGNIIWKKSIKRLVNCWQKHQPKSTQAWARCCPNVGKMLAQCRPNVGLMLAQHRTDVVDVGPTVNFTLGRRCRAVVGPTFLQRFAEHSPALLMLAFLMPLFPGEIASSWPLTWCYLRIGWCLCCFYR